jgi:hypothetical protein
MAEDSLKKLGLGGLIAVTLLVAAGVAQAGTDRHAAGCGPKLVFLVWPHGHPAIPRIPEFPHIPNPHIELYVGFDSKYDVASAGAWIIGGKPPAQITRGGFFTACANYGDALTKGTVASPQVIRQETAVKCAFSGTAVTDVELRANGIADLYLHSGKQMLAIAHATPTSVSLTVPNRRCTLTAPPRP